MPAGWAAAAIIAFLAFLALQILVRLLWLGQALLILLVVVAVEELLRQALTVEASDPLATQIGLVADILSWLVFAWIVVGGLELFVRKASCGGGPAWRCWGF